MTPFTPGLIIESLLILLLVLTVSYCMMLNRRLSRLRSAQQDLHVVIGELCSATETAEHAIRGLKATTEEADMRLSDKLHRAQLLTRELTVLTDEESPAQPAAMAPVVHAAPAAHSRSPAVVAPVRATPPAPAKPRTPDRAAAAADLNDWRLRTMSKLTSAG